MLANATISAVVPVTDLDRARSFYEGLLGLQVHINNAEARTIVYTASGTYLTVYERQTASSGEHTILGFDVGSDFDAIIDRLIAHGITMDTFDVPANMATWDDRGVLNMGSARNAWFKDPDGNVISVAVNML